MNPGDAVDIHLPLTGLRDLLSGSPLFTIGILLFVGFVLAKLAVRARLPEITGFIVAGVVMGDAVTGIVPRAMSQDLQLVTEIALGLISLTIGAEFYAVKLKRLGRAMVVITVVQTLVTLVLVTAALMVTDLAFPYALMLGAIAGATAPGAIVAVVHRLRARGKFIDYLYGLVALDDAATLVLFGLAFPIAVGLLGLGSVMRTESIAFSVAGETMLSILVGLAGGWVIHAFGRGKTNSHESLITTVGVLFMTTSIALVFDLSVIIANLTAGALLINLSPQNHRVFRHLEPFTPPIYALFFVLAGTEFQPLLLLQPGFLLIWVVYVAARSAGKLGGVYLGCRLGGVEPVIRRHLGIGMLPQAGVAIGLVLLLQASPFAVTLPAAQRATFYVMTNVVLLSVFINEIVGPSLTRRAIIRGNQMEA